MLALATVHASRNGVWLLFWLVAPAARGVMPAALAPPLRLAAVLAPLAAGLLVVALVRGPGAQGAPAGMVARVVALAHGTPVLATGGLDEQVALAGGRIWIGNPIDAFS